MYFIYRHIRKDTNLPFYIGKGKCNIKANSIESFYHRAYSKHNRSKYWKNVTSSTEIETQIIFNCETEKEAFEKEVEFVLMYGRFEQGGLLVNMTNGGDGCSGKIVSENTKSILREQRLGTKHSDYSNSLKGSKGEKNYFFGKKLIGKDNGFFGKKHSIELIEEKFKGKNNPMFGKRGNLNPFFGKSHTKEFLRKKQLAHSFKVFIFMGEILIQTFECTQDAADFYSCTKENILFRIGKPSAKFGKFRGLTIAK